MKTAQKMKIVPEIIAKAWDVVVCGNGHACLLVVRPFSLASDKVFNSNFVVIDGGDHPRDNMHWGAFRCRRCGQHILMDETGFILRIRKPVQEGSEK